MKLSAKFAALAFGATSLIALAVPTASAQVVGGSNCSNLRYMSKLQCLTRATDPMQGKEGDLKRDGPANDSDRRSHAGPSRQI
jgi:hypothetical protein